jgi:DNA polymerase-4
MLTHPELDGLAIAHIDCDAFYASVEKRDDPSLADKPVIIGGGTRGVVSAACYVARMYGVRSAMPMFKALAACPDAVVIRPNMAKYSAVGREVRALMLAATPLVEPISIDEAFLDLTGTEALHGSSPAMTLARLVGDIEREIGVTASVGLSYNKFLAKVASDLDKPRGFAVIGRAEARDFLAPKPVGMIWGVGKALERKLAGDGVFTIGQLQGLDEARLSSRYGSMGRRLFRFARGEDDRKVEPGSETKSVSAETTFNSDIASAETLNRALWPLCETVSRRMKAQGLAGYCVTLKLKTAGFQTITRSRSLPTPTQLAETLYQAGGPLLEKAADGRRFRLIGIGLSDLVDAGQADTPDLFDRAGQERRRTVETTMDGLRAKLGEGAIFKGRGLRLNSDNGKDESE